MCAPSYKLKVTSVTLFPPMSVAPGSRWGILSSPKHFLVRESMVLHNVDRLGTWELALAGMRCSEGWISRD